MRTLTQNLGGKLVKFEVLCKSIPFNVLETCRVYLLTIDLGIVECIKKFIQRFFEQCEICGHGPNYVQKMKIRREVLTLKCN